MKKPSTTAVGFNPFLANDTADSSEPPVPPQLPVAAEETEKSWSGKALQDSVSSQQWTAAVSGRDLEGDSYVPPSWAKSDGDESDETVGATDTDMNNVRQQPSEIINSDLRNPFSAMQQNEQGRVF